MKTALTNLLKVKSIVTIIMTVALVALLFMPEKPDTDITALFCTSYGAVITYFFTRKDTNQ